MGRGRGWLWGEGCRGTGTHMQWPVLRALIVMFLLLLVVLVWLGVKRLVLCAGLIVML